MLSRSWSVQQINTGDTSSANTNGSSRAVKFCEQSLQLSIFNSSLFKLFFTRFTLRRVKIQTKPLMEFQEPENFDCGVYHCKWCINFNSLHHLLLQVLSGNNKSDYRVLEERSEISLASFYLPEMRSIIFMAKGKRYQWKNGRNQWKNGGEIKLVYRQLQRRKNCLFKMRENVVNICCRYTLTE